MNALQKRLQALEQRSGVDGPFVVVYDQDDQHHTLTPAALEQRIADAHAANGPGTVVIVVKYVATPLPNQS